METNSKMREKIEECTELLVINIAKAATDQLTIIASKKLTFDFPANPSMFKILESTQISYIDPKIPHSENIIRDQKIRKIFNNIYQTVEKNTNENSIISGRTCVYYLKGFCFLTMKSILYSCANKLLSFKGKGKTEQIVFF